MRYAMLATIVVLAITIGNIIDIITGSQDSTPNLPFVVGGIAVLVALNVYMFKTPDRNFVPMHKVKKYIPTELYDELKKKGPYQ